MGTPRKVAVTVASREKQHHLADDMIAYGKQPKRTFPPCSLCELLGNPMGNAHTHALDFCFANPLSHKMIKQVAWNRMQKLQAMAEKQELPDWTKPILEAAQKLEKPEPKEKAEG